MVGKNRSTKALEASFGHIVYVGTDNAIRVGFQDIKITTQEEFDALLNHVRACGEKAGFIDSKVDKLENEILEMGERGWMTMMGDDL